MISLSSVFRWAVSQDKALANARAAAVECSRRRVEAAEVEAYVAAYRERYADAMIAAAEPWTAREVTSSAR